MKDPIVLAIEYIDENNIPALDSLLDLHLDIIDAKTFFAGGTLLHYASAEGAADAVNLLLKKGFDPNKPATTYGETPLHAACRNGNVENMEILLAHGGHIDTSESYRNPLFAAIIGSSSEIVQRLLEAGIDSNVVYTLEDGSVVDALEFARRRGEVDCIHALEKFESS